MVQGPETGGVDASAPPAPPAAEGRLDGLDLARGVAVVSMLVAHLSPAGGVLTVSEYLTAPLFALVIGTSMGLRLASGRRSAGRFALDNLLRGLVLVVIGLVLQRLYSQIDVILPHLGVLVVVLAPVALLLWRLPVLTVGVSVALAVLSPVLMERAREYAVANLTGSDEATRYLVGWVASGQHYRLTSLLPMALGGLALAAVLPRAGEPPRGYAIASVLFGASLGAYLVGDASVDGARAYSGSTAEIVGATFLAAGTVVLAFVAVALGRRWGVQRLLEPVLATGRLALTAYTLQVVALALIAQARGGAQDDSWTVLGVTGLVVLGGCWALDRRWGTGPLEWLLHATRVPEPGRRDAG